MNDDLKQKFLPDEYIFNQGEKGDKAYLLLDGRVAIEVNGKKVAEISEMEIFGEMSLILKKPRSASIKALKPTIVLPINQKILEDLLSNCPPVVSSLIKQLAYRLSQCDSEIESLKKNAEVIIIDSPPIGLFPDSLAIARKVEEVLFVTRYGKVSRKVVKSLIGSIKETGVNLLGVVLNDLPQKKTPGYYYSGYYGYGYFRYKYYNKYYGKSDAEEKRKKKQAVS